MYLVPYRYFLKFFRPKRHLGYVFLYLHLLLSRWWCFIHTVLHFSFPQSDNPGDLSLSVFREHLCSFFYFYCFKFFYMQFTYHKTHPSQVYSLVFLVYSQSCAAINHHCLVPEHFHPPKRNSVPINSYFRVLPPPSPWQLVIYFLSLLNLSVLDLRTNRIIRYTAFCVWLLPLSTMFSGFVCGVAGYVCTSFLWLANIPLYWGTTFHLSIIHRWTSECCE